MKLTHKQQKVLDCIVQYIVENNYPPSSREIGAIVNHKSSSTTHGIFVRLRQKGYIDWEDTKPRTLRVLKGA
ncbi:LexA family protein [Bacillus solitudinis]|uniref:LexA family protein n=1 Tax=Bacillus solitudinis TaxID=2014074 RepID=UPI000C23BA8F|nr:transcriptional regulator [Bacillus solitudinis]